MRRLRKAKIVATLGPSSSDKQTIRALCLMQAWTFSDSISATARMKIIAHATMSFAKSKAKSAARLPFWPTCKVRSCASASSPTAKSCWNRAPSSLSTATPQTATTKRVCLPHPELFDVITAGQNLLLDDGKLRLRVIDSDGFSIRTRSRYRRRAVGPQRRERPGRHSADSGAHRKRSSRFAFCTVARRGLDCTLVCAATGRFASKRAKLSPAAPV